MRGIYARYSCTSWPCSARDRLRKRFTSGARFQKVSALRSRLGQFQAKLTLPFDTF